MHIAMTKLPDTPTAPLAAGPTAADDLCCRPFYRKRCTNFTDDDRRLLLRLIRPHLTVIENKNAERTTSIRKKDTWTSIAVQYNARMRQTAGTVRTPSQLKLCYEAMKYKLRKSLKVYIYIYIWRNCFMVLYACFHCIYPTIGWKSHGRPQHNECGGRGRSLSE